jgi:hypothetical protein
MLEHYDKDSVPAHLMTATQLRKAGYKLASGQTNVAVSRGNMGAFVLYDIRECVQIKKRVKAVIVSEKS